MWSSLSRKKPCNTVRLCPTTSRWYVVESCRMPPPSGGAHHALRKVCDGSGVCNGDCGSLGGLNGQGGGTAAVSEHERTTVVRRSRPRHPWSDCSTSGHQGANVRATRGGAGRGGGRGGWDVRLGIKC